MKFWQIVCAVALGTLLAFAVAWVATELRIRAELHSAAELLEAEAKKIDREMRQMADQSRRLDRERRARIEAAKPPRLKAASPNAESGMVRCLNGFTVKRVNNGWIEIFDPTTGERFPCRQLAK